MLDYRNTLSLGLLFVATAVGTTKHCYADEPRVSIRSNFPGGNVVVLKNEGVTLQLAPDLRGGKPWFYWQFEAQASQTGRVTFIFPGNLKIGVNGPAYSLDEGKSWQWLGDNHVEYAMAGTPPASQKESFYYDFAANYLKVRFAVAIPYLQHDLDEFLKRHASNPLLKEFALTKTQNGVPVMLLQVGEPSSDKKAVLVTARHHACESMASYVLEGFLQEAISNSYAGVEFRKKYVLFSVPIVDKDGVQAGDQGKNRSPHDHNRDYGAMPIFPEIQAIQNLAEAQNIRHAMDLHCPSLRTDIHEAFHFMGLGLPHIRDNVNELIGWLKEERPQAIMAPLNVLADATKPNAANPAINSHHFALRDGSYFAATLEIPYTQKGNGLNAAMAREYGRSLLRAWNRSTFLHEKSDSSRGDATHQQLHALRATFQKNYRSTPQEMEALTRTYLDNASASPLFKIEANILMAQMRLQQKRYQDALAFCEDARKIPNPTNEQSIATALLRIQIHAKEPQTSPQQLELLLKEFLEIPYPANENLAKAFEAVSVFHQSKNDMKKAIDGAKRQLEFAQPYDKGKVLNRIASLHEENGQPQEATAARQEVVRLFRARLTNKPERSAFGVTMVTELFEAIYRIPTATLEEKQAVANLVLNHDIVTTQTKDNVRKRMAELVKK